MNKFAQKIGLTLLLVPSIITNAWADDVEIYFNNVAATSNTGEPLVMFSLDYRSNLVAPICSDVDSCNISYTDDNDTPDDTSDDQTLTTSLTDYWTVSPASIPLITNYDPIIEELAAAVSADDRADGVFDFLELLRGALRVVLNNITGVKVGLMLNHDHINNCQGNDAANSKCSNGGYIAMGFQSVDGDDSTSGGDDVLLAKLAALPSPQGNYSHPYQGAELYFELFRYLTGGAIYNGHVGYVDYADPCDEDNLDNTTSGSCNNGSNVFPDTDVNPLISWDATTSGTYAVENPSHTEYISPFENAETECAGVYAVNLMFGVANQDNDSNDAINTAAPSGMGVGTASNNSAFYDTIGWLFKDNAAYRDLASTGNPYGLPVRKGNQNVTSYFLYKGNVSNQMNAYAGVGGSTKALKVTEDPKALIEILRNVFESFKRQNSTFEAPAVTVNSYSSLTHRDELYYALFAPELGTPNWPGNLKKYKLIEVPKTEPDGTTWIDTVVGDANANPAVAEQSELFLPEACSFWTNCSTPIRDCDGEDGITADDICPDGDEITWGGAVEELTTTRKVFSDITGDSNVNLADPDNALHEDNANITAAMLGIDITNATDFSDPANGVDANDVAAQRQRLLRIGRGVNPTDPTEVIFALGDPIHARPSVIEYDSDVNSASNTGDAPDLAIAMTTNEGFFHLIKESDGTEYFSFIPDDLLPLLGQVNGPTEKPLVTEPGGTAAGDNRYNTYGLDGSPVIWAHDYNHDGDLLDTNADADLDEEDYVLAFLTQRRGGSSIYALDITNKTSPRLLWKKHGARDYDDYVSPATTSGFDRLGQTWSEPAKAVIKVANADEEKIPTPVLIFGGGYDDIKAGPGDLDHDDGWYASDGRGRAIYVVDAETGNLRWTICNSCSGVDLDINEMNSSIPAKVRVLDIDNDNYVDRVYAVDVVGRVFRIDFDNSGPTTTLYSGGMVADLSDPYCPEGPPAGGVAEPCQRRFFNAPDVALQIGFPIAPYYQIAVGSGYRPSPRSVPGIQNQFYMLFDTNVTNKIHPNGYGTGQYTDGGVTYDQQYHWEITASDETTNLVDVTYFPDTDNNATLGDAIFAAEEALLGENKHGWYFDMNIFYNIKNDSDPDNGTSDMDLNEHILAEAVTVQGLTFFTSYLQDINATDDCKVNLGQGRVYVVDSFTGLPVADLVNGNPLDDSSATTTTHRFNPLDRTGIPTDPLVVFRKNSEGQIDPVVIVGSDLPLTGKEGLLEKNAYTKTWWLDLE